MVPTHGFPQCSAGLKNSGSSATVVELRERVVQQKRYDVLKEYAAEVMQGVGEWTWSQGSKSEWIARSWMSMDAIFAAAYEVCGRDAEPSKLFDTALIMGGGDPEVLEHVQFLAYLLATRSDD